MASVDELTLRAQAARAGVSMSGFRDPALIAAAMDAVPGMAETAAFTSLRGANTILKGPFKSGPIPGLSSGQFIRRNRSRLNPRNLARLPYIERMDPAIGNRTFGGMRDGRVISRNIFGPDLEGFRTPKDLAKTDFTRRRDLSMFQAGRIANFGLSKFLSTRVGSRSALARPLQGLTLTKVGMEKGLPFASGGFGATQLAAARLGVKGSSLVGETRAANIANFLKVSNPNVIEALGGADNAAARLAAMNRTSASQVLSMSGQGIYNQFIGGAIATGRGPITQEAAEIAVQTARKSGINLRGGKPGAAKFLMTPAGRGAVFQAQGLAYGGFVPGERMGARGFVGGMRAAYRGVGVEAAEATFAAQRRSLSPAARAVGEKALDIAGRRVAGQAAKRAAVSLGARFAGRFAIAAGVAAAGGPVGWVVGAALTAWMIYDIAKLGGMMTGLAAKATVRTIGEGYRSLEGGINKAPMSGFDGFGYQDTSAAATSRQRGVMAIQNSRLNARSILGSEAGMMHAHFG